MSGRELLGQGETDEALLALRIVSPQSACAPQALTLTARAHADLGDLDLAAAEVQRALEIDTLNEEAQLLLGVIFGRQGQWPLAIQQLERARYLSADSALVSFYLAEAYRQDGRNDKAAREYRNTLRKLNVHPPGMLLDGVAVGWLRETCQRQMNLPRSMNRNRGVKPFTIGASIYGSRSTPPQSPPASAHARRRAGAVRCACIPEPPRASVAPDEDCAAGEISRICAWRATSTGVCCLRRCRPPGLGDQRYLYAGAIWAAICTTFCLPDGWGDMIGDVSGKVASSAAHGGRADSVPPRGTAEDARPHAG